MGKQLSFRTALRSLLFPAALLLALLGFLGGLTNLNEHRGEGAGQRLEACIRRAVVAC